MCRPACPRALISDDMLPQSKLFADIPAAFEPYAGGAFRFVHGTAAEVDHVKRTVSVGLAGGGAETIDFFALVIVTGASTPSPLLGFTRDERFLRESWAAFRRALPGAKTIVIAGGGPPASRRPASSASSSTAAPACSARAPRTPTVAIIVVTAGSEILPLLRPSMGRKAEKYLAKVGVRVVKSARVKTVAPEGAGTADALTATTTVTLENGTTIDADLYIPATGLRPNTAFLDGSLLAADGRVEANASTLRVDRAGPRIYAIGDASSTASPAVHNILLAVPVLCANIKRDLLLAAGEDESAVGPDRAFQEDTRETQLVPIGKSKGVGAIMGFRLPSFLVWLVKGIDYWLWTVGKLWSGKQWATES